MKKVLSVVLAVVMLLSAFTGAAYAADSTGFKQISDYTDVPLIEIRGDGNSIYDENDERVYCITDIDEVFKSAGDDDGNLKQSVMNVLYPFLVQGVMFDNWEPYYEALQKEIGDLFEKSLLDENGNPRYGTGISKSDQRANEIRMNTNYADKKTGKFSYDSGRYRFNYDWRLDPLYNAAKLKEFIDAIKKATGCEEVCILSNCLGTVVATAYVAQYGMDGIRGIGYDAGAVNGAEFVSEAISGKFKLDLNAVNRMFKDLEATGQLSLGEDSDFIFASIDMLAKNGVFDAVKGVSKELVYYKLVKGVTSALALSTAFTFPGYWACVTSADYETAKEYVFGKEGSEKRQKYAGLIEKLDNYDVKVRQNIYDIVNQINDEGNLAVVVKYGIQLIPISESANEISDELCTVKSSSFGAVTSDIYSTLDKDYIASKEAAGLGKYISPDKQIDASTCLAPDKTWFIKGCSHGAWPIEPRKLIATVISSDEELTVDDFEFSQYTVYNSETKTISKMTEDNCHTENWEADEKYDKPNSWANFLINFLRSLFNWFTALIKKIG